MDLTLIQEAQIQSDILDFARIAKPKKLRSMLNFAEQEIIIPDGKYKNQKYNPHRQPYARVYLDAVDSGNWSRFFATGPTQSGKTLTCFVIPIMYHLFEVVETVICGLPTGEMKDDKWKMDLFPVIAKSQYAKYLPDRGRGSQGGVPDTIEFKNGSVLKFMTAGGSDKKRAGFSSRVLVMSEIDGFDEQGETSREADKISQLEERTSAETETRKRIYGECTVSIDRGRIWQEYTKGTATRILLECPHCKQWVTPEREHLKGWQDANSDVEAREKAYFICPDCSEAWSEQERFEANETCRVIHKGEELTPEGDIVGNIDPTFTLGFRWSAVNNFFQEAGDVGVAEWRASREEDEENAEKKLKQFRWAIPYEPPIKEFSPLNVTTLTQRQSGFPHLVIPDSTIAVSLGVDVGKWLLWYCGVAWLTPKDGVVFDYGAVDVPSAYMDEEAAIVNSLREMKGIVDAVWTSQPTAAFIDSGYKNKPVYSFVTETGMPYWPAKGFGQGEKGRKYEAPPEDRKGIEFVTDHYHGSYQDNYNIVLIDADSDHWKSVVHNSFSVPISDQEEADEVGTLTIYDTLPKEHLSYAKHITAEKKIEEFKVGRGDTVRWEPVRKANHLLDATALACAAGDLSVKLALAPPPPPKSQQNRSGKSSFTSRRMNRR